MPFLNKNYMSDICFRELVHFYMCGLIKTSNIYFWYDSMSAENFKDKD